MEADRGSMAILWKQCVGGTHYEVRSAGHTRRLYTDGVFHSQFNLRRPVTGGIWDLLTLPAFFYPPGHVRRVLVLGVGGGAVIRQLLHFHAPREVVGIELDPVHLDLARRFFGLDDARVALVQAEAVAWVAAYAGPPFDLIIDDAFGGSDGEPVRAVPATAAWFRALRRHLAPQGALVLNFIANAELYRCGYFASPALARRFGSAFRLSHPLNENAIGAFLHPELHSRTLRANLAGVRGLDPARRTSLLRYRICRL